MSKCWYCNEELTTANYCEDHMGICTKCYDSMFKVGNDFVKGLTDKIADLEAKLAEKDEQIKRRIAVYEKQFIEQINENYELRHQLAEKDLRIEELESQFAYECECNKQFVECQKQNEQLKQQLVDREQELEDWLDGTMIVKLCELEKQLAEKEEELEDWKDGTIVEKLWHLETKLVEKEKEKEIEFIKHEREANGTSYVSACKELTKERQDKISFCIEQLEKVKEYNATRVYSSSLVDKFIDNQIEELKKEMKHEN